MLRDGIEDYEYLAMLKRLLNEHQALLSSQKLRKLEKLLQVPPEISKDLRTFTKDPAPIEARRQAIARAIEKLILIDLTSQEN